MSTWTRVFLSGLILLGSAGVASADGNANFVLGGRTFSDQDFWEPNDSQGVFGVTVGFGPSDWPISLAAGTYVSAKQERVSVFVPGFGIVSAEFTTAVAEISFGVQKVWKQGTNRPFLGGGLSTVAVAGDLDAFGINVDDNDQTFGAYVEGGIFWRLGSRFNIGLHARALVGTDINVDFGGPWTAEGDADYVQLGMILGWGWPPE